MSKLDFQEHLRLALVDSDAVGDIGHLRIVHCRCILCIDCFVRIIGTAPADADDTRVHHADAAVLHVEVESHLGQGGRWRHLDTPCRRV
jgi:hypothetical protein